MRGSRCKASLPDLHKFTAARRQICDCVKDLQSRLQFINLLLLIISRIFFLHALINAINLCPQS
jgi:hypothetical protein